MDLSFFGYAKIKAFLFMIIIIILFFLSNIVLKEQNRNYYIEIDSIETFENVKNGIVFFGRPTCPYCEKVEPIIRDIASENKIVIYYFNSDQIRNTQNIEKSVLQEYLLDYEVESVPAILVMRNGVIVENLSSSLYSENESIKRVLVNSLDVYKDMSNSYIPHYSIAKILLVFSLLFLLSTNLLGHKVVLNKNVYALLTFLNILVIFINARNYSLSVAYVDNLGYSGNEIYFILSMLSIVIFLISTLFILIKRKEHNNLN